MASDERSSKRAKTDTCSNVMAYFRQNQHEPPTDNASLNQALEGEYVLIADEAVEDEHEPMQEDEKDTGNASEEFKGRSEQTDRRELSPPEGKHRAKKNKELKE